MTGKKTDSIVVLDKSSRRHFMRAGSGVLLAGAALVSSSPSLAADCDDGGERSSSSDQDEGSQADRKECQPRNIVSQNQPKRLKPVVVDSVKA